MDGHDVAPGDSSCAEARAALLRQVVLWQVGHAGFGDVVLAACDALVAGCDGERLAHLAGESVHSQARGTLDPALVPAVLTEQGLPDAAPEFDRLWVAAQLAREVLAGRLAPVDLVRWAYRECFDGPEALQPLVSAEYEYELAPPGLDAFDRVDTAVLVWCRRFVGAWDGPRR